MGKDRSGFNVKIVIAPDKFRGSLTAEEAARAIAEGVLLAQPMAEIDICPVADGGEGTVSALVAATGGRLHTCRVTGPLPERKVEATFGMLGEDGPSGHGLETRGTAVIEMAAASGLALLASHERNPLYTTTFGTGELLNAAARLGARHIILGLGGSATNDGGIGCAQACGLPVILEDGEPLSATEPLTGSDLPRVVLIKHGRGSPVERVAITVACDVVNPLFGPHGASRVYGPQKGATPEQVEQLDADLRRLAERTGKLAEAMTPGAGAAGGLGFAMLAFFGAKVRPGVDLLIETTGLRRRLAGADLCITGEGKLDGSSLHGKAPIGVARLCRELGIRCVAIAGSVGPGAERALDEGLTDYVSLHNASMSVDHCMQHARELLVAAAERMTRKVIG
jgi:glycerate kinase